MATFRGSGSVQNGAAFPTEAELQAAIDESEAAASASASSASASAASAVVSGGYNDSALAAQVAAELAETNAETAQTAAELAETNAETAQTAAELAETNAETAEVNSEAAQVLSEAAQTAAEVALTATEAVLAEFETMYLGDFASEPTLDNEGNALIVGALYWNNVNDEMSVWDGAAWVLWSWLALAGGTMTGDLKFTTTSFSLYDEGNFTTTGTVDWTQSNKIKCATMSGTTTLTFTAPVGVGNLTLLVKNSGGDFITWPSNVDWPSGTAPVLPVGTNDISIFSFFYDGARYYAAFGLDYY